MTSTTKQNIPNLKLLVDETYSLENNNPKIEKTCSLIETVYFNKSKTGFYTFEYNGKQLDIPSNWGLFSEFSNQENICNVAERDYAFYEILCAYFEVYADIYLGYDFENRAYFIISQKKEKAA